MPRLPIDYSKTIIYKICCNDVSITDIYVGHTTDIIRRRQEHKYNCNCETKTNHNHHKYQFIRDNGGWENWSLVPVEEYPCENVNQAKIRERYWIETLQASLNKVIPSRSQKEWSESNKDKITEYKKEWYENNKNKLNKKNKEYREVNKEKIAEKAKQRYECNKDKLLEKFTCECGAHYVFSTKLRHFRSKKHQEHLSAVNKDRQESTEQTIT